jgi:hypothetical protein
MANTTIGALTGTAGGTNIPLADMSTDAAEYVVVVRAAHPSDGTPYETVPASTLFPPGARTEFNFILESRADLVAVVAPVGGIFILPTGSYFLKTSFALNANEGLRVDNVPVFIQGGGAGKVLTGGSAAIPLLQVQGAAGAVQLLTLSLTQAVANGVVIECGGDVSTITQCIINQPGASATNPAIDVVSDGRVSITASRVLAVNRCLRHASTQRVAAQGSRFESQQGPNIDITGANNWMSLEGCIVRTTVGGAGQCFLMNSATANVHVTDTECSTATTATIALVGPTGVGEFAVTGGEWQTGSVAAGTFGLQITGPVSKCIDMTNVSVMNCDTFVQWTSGLVAAANVTYCTGTVNVGPCINWGVANIPTRGLREIGNSWNEPTANVFLGHAQNDARVMRRQNFSATANMSETGIVP